MAEAIVLGGEIKPNKVGIVPCNGEEICEGTITRFACRKVLEKLRPANTVTICLPLFIAGGKGEKEFAQKFPTITVDGCEKRCSQKSTERLSGKPRESIVVTELLKERGIGHPESRRALTEEGKAAMDIVADEIVKKVDEILQKG
ncbi:MAG: hypothetical protein HPY50_01825 [Firmicutes bacterium]|nr:hypothetical protein [Bacillota bacterium]